MNKVKALFPDNVEKIIISKDDYDRLTGELTLENIELKQEIERLNNQLDFIKDQNKYIDKLEKMVKERNSIIKEAREYIEELAEDTEDYIGAIDRRRKVELLEILDKVEENK